MTTAEMLISNKMKESTNKTLLRTAALTAGLALLIMVIAAPFAELFVFPRLIVPENAAETAKNILANQTLFRAALIAYLITFICDLVAAWCRLVYTVIAVVAFLNLVTVIRLLNASNSLTVFDSVQFPAQLMSLLEAFRSSWYFGLLFFGLHLGLLGYLVLRSSYIPGILGGLLIIAGLGYLTNAIKPVLFPNIDTDFAQFTFYGELVFMLWLLIKGSRLKEID